MQLALDIGNTRQKTGLFQGNALIETRVMSEWNFEALADYCKQSGVRRIMVSSVAQADPTLFSTLSQYFEIQELTHETLLPFENRYTTPQTLGKDRLAAIAGAQALMPGRNCLIIDCGTCIKYDLITAEGVYWGGNIAPGAQMRSKAMHTFTARLPEVPFEMPSDFIGSSTQTALQNGAFLGATLEMQGFVQLFRQRFASLQLILSGGDAVFFQERIAYEPCLLEPHLILYGLNNLLNFNS